MIPLEESITTKESQIERWNQFINLHGKSKLKLPEEKVQEVKQRLNQGESVSQIKRELSMGHNTIIKIRRYMKKGWI